MIKHHHPAYQDQGQPTQASAGRMVANEDIAAPNPADPYPKELADDYEPDYEAITERRQERHRPDWA